MDDIQVKFVFTISFQKTTFLLTSLVRDHRLYRMYFSYFNLFLLKPLDQLKPNLAEILIV
jgi:hypothetical protein